MTEPTAWEPPLSLEERLKALLVPGRLYTLYRWGKEKRRGETELHLVPFLCDPLRTAIDAGANKGVWAEALRRHARQVHAFEPNPKVFRILRQGAAANVQTHALALSDVSGTAELRVPRGSHGYSNQGGSLSAVKIGNAPYGAVTVETRRLDDLDLGDIGFIKIDVEGHELAVLAGAAETLRRCRPTLAIEIEERHSKRPIAEALAEVCAHGYDAFALDGGVLRRASSVLERRGGRQDGSAGYVFNWIFLPH